MRQIRIWRARLIVFLRRLGRSKALSLRTLACLLVGLALLFIDTEPNYDLRFTLRGPQKISQNIVLIVIHEREWSSLVGETQNLIRPLKEITSLTDSYYWHEPTWARLLSTLLTSNPKIIGITFYFGDNLSPASISGKYNSIFRRDRIIWAGDLDGSGRVIMPKFANAYATNVGIAELRIENDGIVRYFSSHFGQHPHLALRLARQFDPAHASPPRLADVQRVPINFLGPAHTYPQYSLSDVLEKRIGAKELAGKIVLIGAEDLQGHRFLTPVGSMSLAEVYANMTDDILNNRWIVRTHNWIYAIYLWALLLLSISIISYYPQAVAMMFFALIGLFVTAISAWIFDTYYFWIPALAPVLQLTATYIIFLSYLVTVKEKETWQLEQEKRYIFELEQLKNNFVSLISHDLKTPIARIQAIVDRLMAQSPSPELKPDLQSIRKSSDDLHRYIQSILQMARVESRDFKLNKEVVDINELIDQARQRLQQVAKDRRIQLECHLEPMFSIELDPTLIFEVILNLVENAIKYTPENGSVKVISQEVADRVSVLVEDNGPGIPVEDQSRIWEKFYRGSLHSMSTKGSGLGLYLVKYFIELHGGEVFLKSTPGQGTRIGFSLPIEAAGEGAAT